jgi:hypothetical protein
MPKAAAIQTNFTAGELSPRLEGRVDISKYFNGVQTLKNMVIHPHGGTTRRGGTKHISNAKLGDKKIRLIPFQFSVEQAYILEFGEGYIRFYRDEAQIGGGGFSLGFSTGFAGAANIIELSTTYLESELFEIQFVQSADVLYLVHPAHLPAKLSRIAVDTFSIQDESFINGPYQDENTSTTTITPSAVTGAGITLTASASVFSSTDVGRIVRIDEGADFGYATITAFTSATVVSADVNDDFVSTSTRISWRLGAFSETTGYPSAIAFYEDRLMYAGTITQPQTIWGSQSNIYNDFGPGDVDSDAITYTINSDQVNAIRWLSPGKSLTVGTVGGEFLMSASSRDEAITPSNVKIVRQSEYGGAYVMPIRSNGVVLFLQRSTKKLRQFIYQFESDSYVAPDLTLLSEHITANGVVEMDYQNEPDSIVWLVRKDGTLLGMTYERDQEVVGWHRHTVGGVSDGNGTAAQVESVGVIPSGDKDQLWMSVKRYINGETVRQIDVLAEGRSNINPVDGLDFFVDAGVSYNNGATTVISGLDHLEGETVQVLADGAVKPDAVVLNGLINLDTEATQVSVGLKYTSDLETMRIEAGSADGSAQSKIKRIQKIDIRFFETLGAMFGPSENELDTIYFRSTSDKMDQAPPRFTGDKEQPFPNGYDTEGRVFIRQEQPLPMTILAIMPRVRTNG